MTSMTAPKALAGAALLTFAVCEAGCGDNKKIGVDAPPIPKACLDSSATTVQFAGLHTLETNGAADVTGTLVGQQSMFAAQLINTGCGVAGSTDLGGAQIQMDVYDSAETVSVGIAKYGEAKAKGTI